DTREEIAGSGRDHDPDRLSSRLAGIRVVRSAMVASRAGHRPATRPQGEERLAECPPNAGRRDTRPAAPAARTGAVLARLYDRADGPMTPKAFHALFGRIGERAKMPFPVHPHMLRHGCGYALANAGHDTRALQAWLGHKNIQHTVRYTELAPDGFKNFWR